MSKSKRTGNVGPYVDNTRKPVTHKEREEDQDPDLKRDPEKDSAVND